MTSTPAAAATQHHLGRPTQALFGAARKEAVPMRALSPAAKLVVPIVLAAALAGCATQGPLEGSPTPAAKPVAVASGERPANPEEPVPAPCPTADHASRVLGLDLAVIPEATATRGDVVSCGFGGTDPSLGVFFSLMVGPASRSAQVDGEIRSDAKVLGGTTPQRIALAAGGLAFGSSSKSAADVVSGDRVYYVEVVATGRSVGDKRDRLVRMLTELVG